jgi:ParB/RepB/Spo0J family partition protein
VTLESVWNDDRIEVLARDGERGEGMAAKKKSGTDNVWVGFAKDAEGEVRYCRLGNGELSWRIGEACGLMEDVPGWPESGYGPADLEMACERSAKAECRERAVEINRLVRAALAKMEADRGGLPGDTWTHPKTGVVYDVKDAGRQPFAAGEGPCNRCALDVNRGGDCDGVPCVQMKYGNGSYLAARPLVREVVEPTETLAPERDHGVVALASVKPEAGRLVMIAPVLIRPSPWQVREVEGTPELDAGLEELAASIRANGLANPLTVRALPNGDWELVAGHRRRAASVRAGLAEVPCYIVEAGDRQAMDMLLVENLQRKDLTAIEEAHSVARMLAGGRTHEEIAAATGKSVRWVYRRASIMDIMTDWQALAVKMRLSAAYLEKVGRLPAGIQEELSKRLNVQNVLRSDDPEAYSWKRRNFERGGDVAALDEAVERLTRRLESAPWWGKHAEWCEGCLKRTDAQPDLFDADEWGAGEAGPRCLSEACWGTKQAQCVQVTRGELAKKYGTVEEIKCDSFWRYQDKKSKTHSVPVLVVDGDRAGEVRWGAAPTAEDVAAASKPKGPTPKQKDEALTIRAIESLIESADDLPEWADEEEGGTARASLRALLVCALACGVQTHSFAPKGVETWCGSKRLKALGALLGEADEADVLAALWVVLKPCLVRSIRFETISCCEEQYKTACAIAAHLGIPKAQIATAKAALAGPAKKRGKKGGEE